MNTPLITQSELQSKLEAHQKWYQARHQGASPSPTRAGLVLLDSTIKNVRFSNAFFSDAKVVRCLISSSHFENCDFTGSLFIDSTFENCSFINCDFHKADFRDANCTNTNFSNSRLSSADLSGANFKGANLSNCNLSWAWLINTDLRNAHLENVKLEGTRLIGTKMYNTKKFHISSTAQMTIEDIDMSLAGDRSILKQEEGLKSLMAEQSPASTTIKIKNAYPTFTDEHFEQALIKLYPTWAAKYPKSNRPWSWQIKKKLANHLLLNLSFHNPVGGGFHKIIWRKNGSVLRLDSWEKFKHLIAEANLDLINDFQDILDIFSFYHSGALLQSVGDVDALMLPKKPERLLKYQGLIKPPLFDTEKKQVTFWYAESLYGNLEIWQFTQKEAGLDIVSWVKEEDFVANLGGCL